MEMFLLIIIVIIDGFLVNYVCYDMQKINKKLKFLEDKWLEFKHGKEVNKNGD